MFYTHSSSAVIFLFNNFLQLDESSNYLYRTVHIHATDEQLQKLFKFSDADDLDGIVAEILSQSNFGTFQLIKELTNDVTTVVWNRMPSFSLDVPPRTKEITINFMLLVFAYIACRRFKINFAIVIVFALGYFLYEYLDYECHQVIGIFLFLFSLIQKHDYLFLTYSESQLKIQLHLFMAKIKIHALAHRRQVGLDFCLAEMENQNVATS